MSLKNTLYCSALALGLLASACGDDSSPATECGSGTMLVGGECVADATCGTGTTLTDGECVSDSTCGAGTTLTNGMCLPNTTPTTTYRQVEHLGRPGIAEALLISPAFLEGYNATAPSFAGAPPAAVTAITAEAKTVLKAVFHGVCLLNGVLGLTAVNGAQPGGVQCGQVGPAVWTGGQLTGTVIDPAQATAAQTYADKVFGLFITDTMRVDTTQATQGYFAGGASVCGAGANAPLLCGGRLLNEDVIDITYYFLFAGASVPTGATAGNTPQIVALVNDGVYFSADNAENSGIGLTTAPDTSNTSQFKQGTGCTNCTAGVAINLTTFPYSAPPN